MSVNEVLFYHCVCLGIELAVIFLVLRRNGRVHALSAGFWAWMAFTLFLFMSPATQLIKGNTQDYALTIAWSGGSEQALWIMVMSLVGVAAFYFGYFRTSVRVTTWRLAETAFSFTRPKGMILGAFLLVGIYALLKYRASLFGAAPVTIQDGRFVGTTTGYQDSAYLFLMVPSILLILLPDRRLRLAGWAVGALFVLAGAADPYGRYLVVSMLIALGAADTMLGGARWRRAMLVAVTLVLGAVLEVRGHANFSGPSDVVKMVEDAPLSIPNLFTSGDVAMLSTWYLQSHEEDTLTGYTYGLPVVNYVLAGYLPSALFPDKYFLIDWLHRQQKPIANLAIYERLAGQKSGLLGSFYGEGGVPGVVLLSLLAGFLVRKLDGLLDPAAPDLVRATGLVWLCVLWMQIGSDDYWGLQVDGSLAIPTLLLWLVSKKVARSGYRPHETVERWPAVTSADGVTPTP